MSQDSRVSDYAMALLQEAAGSGASLVIGLSEEGAESVMRVGDDKVCRRLARKVLAQEEAIDEVAR